MARVVDGGLFVGRIRLEGVFVQIEGRDIVFLLDGTQFRGSGARGATTVRIVRRWGPKKDTRTSVAFGRHPIDGWRGEKSGRTAFFFANLFERGSVVDDPGERRVHVLIMHRS